MIDLECPSCGRTGSAPNDKVNSRLVCKKCHTVFHVTPTGRSILGEPAPPGRESAKDKAAAQPHHVHPASAAGVSVKEKDWAEGLFEMSGQRMKGLAAVALFAIAGLGYYFLLGGSPDILTIKAQDAANALAAEDVSTLKGFAQSRTRDDVGRWFDALKNRVGDIKKASTNHQLLASIFVTEEASTPVTPRRGGRMLFAPATGSTRDKNIASEAGLSSSAKENLTQVMTFRVLEPWLLADRRLENGPKLP